MGEISPSSASRYLPGNDCRIILTDQDTPDSATSRRMIRVRPDPIHSRHGDVHKEAAGPHDPAFSNASRPFLPSPTHLPAGL